MCEITYHGDKNMRIKHEGNWKYVSIDNFLKFESDDADPSVLAPIPVSLVRETMTCTCSDIYPNCGGCEEGGVGQRFMDITGVPPFSNHRGWRDCIAVMIVDYCIHNFGVQIINLFLNDEHHYSGDGLL